MNVEEGMRRLGDPNEWDLTLSPRAGAFPARSQRAKITLFSLAAVAVVAVAVATSIVLTSLPTTPPVANPVPAPTSETSPPAEPDPTPDPVVTPTPPVYTAPESCRSLLDSDLAGSHEADGWSFSDERQFPDSYEQKVRDEPSDRAPYLFLDYGDEMVCSFGVENSDVGVKFAFGPISPEQATEQRTKLEDAGLTVKRRGSFDLYVPSRTDLVDDPMLRAYAFGDGVWAYVFDHSGSEGPNVLLKSIVDNAPEQ